MHKNPNEFPKIQANPAKKNPLQAGPSYSNQFFCAPGPLRHSSSGRILPLSPERGLQAASTQKQMQTKRMTIRLAALKRSERRAPCWSPIKDGVKMHPGLAVDSPLSRWQRTETAMVLAGLMVDERDHCNAVLGGCQVYAEFKAAKFSVGG